MEKTIIFYYSKTGNNKFIAERLSKQINADLDVIVPKNRNHVVLFLLTWLKLGVAIKTKHEDLSKYERVIILGPIWMGSLISPIRGFIKKYNDIIKELIFITVCGSGVEDKDGKFGYERVFKEMHKLINSKKLSCYEVSTKSLASKSSSAEPLISEEVFNGKIKKRFEEIVDTIH